MDKLLLESLEIQNFRGFKHLQIEKLGRVNLIVGKNNVGKTALLEALHLYTHKGGSRLVWEMLQERDELRIPWRQASIEDLMNALKCLFFGWKDVRKHSEVIQIGPIYNPDKSLEISMSWAILQFAEDGSQHIRPASPEEIDTVLSLVPRIQFRQGQSWIINYPVSSEVPYPQLRSVQDEIPGMFISASGLSKTTVARLWDEIALTDFEKEVISAFRILAPGIEDISFVSGISARPSRMSNSLGGLNVLREGTSSFERVPIVKIVDIVEPLPLRSLGNGMAHILDIVLALANTQDGLLLIDEIENGIHYSAQK